MAQVQIEMAIVAAAMNDHAATNRGTMAIAALRRRHGRTHSRAAIVALIPVTTIAHRATAIVPAAIAAPTMAIAPGVPVVRVDHVADQEAAIAADVLAWVTQSSAAT